MTSNNNKPSFNYSRLPKKIRDEFDKIYPKALKLGQNLSDQIFSTAPPSWATISKTKDEWVKLEALALNIRSKSKNVVVVGTGGSSLGAQAICGLDEGAMSLTREGPNLYFTDNLSAFSTEALIQSLDFENTHFIIISKSGTTTETIAQFMVFYEAAKLHLNKDDLSNHFTIITQTDNSPLRDFANGQGLYTLDHPNDLSGRFSVFSIVALLPIMIKGFDARALLDGAFEYAQLFKNSYSPAACKGAAAAYALESKGNKTINIIISYDTRLLHFGRWFEQLWSESLGKSNKGTTPIAILGPLYQHSQLQLFLDGPDDKVFTFIHLDTKGSGQKISFDDKQYTSFAYLNGNTIGDVVDSQAQSAIQVLQDYNRPVRDIRLNVLNERYLGYLLMHYMAETIIMAGLWNLEPFDQPAVDLGKNITKKILQKNKL